MARFNTSKLGANDVISSSTSFVIVRCSKLSLTSLGEIFIIKASVNGVIVADERSKYNS